MTRKIVVERGPRARASRSSRSPPWLRARTRRTRRRRRPTKHAAGVLQIGEITIVGRVQKPIAAVDVAKIQPKLTLAELRQPFLDRIEEAVRKDPVLGGAPRGLARPIVALACVVASARRLAWAVAPIDLEPRAVLKALEGDRADAVAARPEAPCWAHGDRLRMGARSVGRVRRGRRARARRAD